MKTMITGYYTDFLCPALRGECLGPINCSKWEERLKSSIGKPSYGGCIYFIFREGLDGQKICTTKPIT